jgi:hypothetical protein
MCVSELRVGAEVGRGGRYVGVGMAEIVIRMAARVFSPSLFFSVNVTMFH